MSVHEIGTAVGGAGFIGPVRGKPSGAWAYRCEAILESHRTEQWILTEED